jgi:hypothetical protein
MKFKFSLLSLLVAAALFAGTGFGRAQTTAFTYQGNLAQNGVAANGSFDFQFALFTNSAAGTAVITTTNAAVLVANGLFTTVIDFGNAFTGTPLWLDIGIRPAGTTNAFTELSARQALTASPYALFSANGGTGAFMYAYDTTIQTLTGISTFKNVNFNNSAAPGNTHWTLSGFLPNSTFTVGSTGVYSIQYDAELTGPGGRTVSFHTQVNNTTEMPGSQASVTLVTNSVNSATHISKSFIATNNAFDVLRLQFSADGSGVSIAPAGIGTTKQSVSLTITRIK